MAPRDRVCINVGGVRYVTQWETLRRPSCSRLSSLTTSDPHYDPESNEFYFDRSGVHFDSILDLHRTGALHIAHSVCVPRFLEELEYWEVTPETIASCCWARVREYNGVMYKLHKVHKSFEDDHLWGLGKFSPPKSAYPSNPAKPFLTYSTLFKYPPTWCRRLRNSIWMMLDRPRSSKLAKVWVTCMIVLTAVAVFTLCAESSSTFWQESCPYNTTCNAHSNYSIDTTYSSRVHLGIFVAEFITNTVFTLEWILSVISCPSIKLYLTRVTCWTDLFAVICSWVMIAAYLEVKTAYQTMSIAMHIIYAGRSLRTLRVLRFFRLMKGWETLTLAMGASLWEIGILCVFFFTGTLVFSVLIFYAEYSNSDTFTNIPIGFWWSIVTMTTVGYGDMYPTTVFGYLVGTACAIAGMFATAVPIPIISENFSSFRLIFQLLGEYGERRMPAIDLDENGKTVFVCPVCHTRAFMTRTECETDGERPVSVLRRLDVCTVPADLKNFKVGRFLDPHHPNGNSVRPEATFGKIFECKVCHTRSLLDEDQGSYKTSL